MHSVKRSRSTPGKKRANSELDSVALPRNKLGLASTPEELERALFCAPSGELLSDMKHL